ncbi:MAG TPA: DNA-deoxyinosine glycosylase, partial [Firmicutes bacterium]|nr:DNA-deoxyinosine glycosylase [Bacillota bacterium]
MKVNHELPPIYDKESRSLILGSIPSIMSRTSKKYYGNKYNRFWTVLETIYDDDSVDWENFIKKHHLALWDVISSCDIDSSKDSSIKNVVPNDISSLLKKTKIN